MLRGIDKRDIFLDTEDKWKFMQKLKASKDAAGFKLYGYCLMDNHVHLVIHESEDIGDIVKRITVSYIRWHNIKHGRTGHLFENRYKSESVEDEAYLTNLLRYVHQNPVKAKIVKYPKQYIWSSYNSYLSSYDGEKSFVDTQLIESYLKSKESFEKYMGEESDDEYLDYKTVTRYSDDKLRHKIEENYDIAMLKDTDKKKRNEIIRDIHRETKVSIRQLSRVLEIGKNIVENAIK